MNKLLWVLCLLSLAAVTTLFSCTYQPPSKVWAPLVGQNLEIEEFKCTLDVAPGPPDSPGSAASPVAGSHCHLGVEVGADGLPDPKLFLRVTKPLFRDYQIAIVTEDEDKSERETGMTCTPLLENRSNELSGSCFMEFSTKASEMERKGTHRHYFWAAVAPHPSQSGKECVKFEFNHGEYSDRHNGTGHTKAL